MFTRGIFVAASLLVIAIVFALTALELGLRLFTPFPVTHESNKRPHPRLAYTLDPRLSDVDSRGFRNKTYTLEEADLAIIGDSHTYGINVAVENNFPSSIAAKTGRKVYNFGVGSYGIYQYKLLIEEAAKFSVRDIILALYPANDLALYCGVIGTDYWQTYSREKGFTLPECEKRQQPRSVIQGNLKLKYFLKGFATVQAVDKLIWQPFRSQRSDQSIANPKTHFMFEGNQSVKKARVRHHSRVTSMEDANVRVNFENSRRFLAESAKILSDSSIGIVVLIIPSKERTIYEWMKRREHSIDEFAELMKNELRLVQAYKDFFAGNGIAYIDAIAYVVRAFELAIEEGATFYPANEAHPLRAGYEAYATAAIEGLRLARGSIHACRKKTRE